jgi:hypothetical protein
VKKHQASKQRKKEGRNAREKDLGRWEGNEESGSDKGSRQAGEGAASAGGPFVFWGFCFCDFTKKKKKENYSIFFLETERRKCVTRVLQRMVGGKLLRGKKGFGGGGRDDDDDPRPKFARSFPSFFPPNIVHRANPQTPGTPQSPTIIHRTETIFLPELQKSHYRPPDGDLSSFRKSR